MNLRTLYNTLHIYIIQYIANEQTNSYSSLSIKVCLVIQKKHKNLTQGYFTKKKSEYQIATRIRLRRARRFDVILNAPAQDDIVIEDVHFDVLQTDDLIPFVRQKPASDSAQKWAMKQGDMNPLWPELVYQWG